MNKSIIMFSETMEGDLFFTGIVTERDLIATLSTTEVALVLDSKASLPERLHRIADVFERRIPDGS